MSNTAAHLVDRVIDPDVTLRQWVLIASGSGNRDMIEGIALKCNLAVDN